MAFHAIGSSYLIRQVAGSERIGGLRVTLYPRSDNAGTVRVELTDWRTGEAHPNPLPHNADIAANAIRRFAQDNEIDLSQIDIKIDHFLFHDVDSDPRCYAQAARSALRSALEALRTQDFPLPGTS